MITKSMKIGFIGQGFVGKNIAADFEQRGNSVVRYSLEPEHIQNKDHIRECDIVFIAVPTPTKPEGFDYSIVEESVDLVGKEKIAVLKSTLIPGTTQKIQSENKDKVILFSPEFLCESTAAYDAAHPMFNIIGAPLEDEKHSTAAAAVASLLPHSEHNFIVPSHTAELFKYIHNIHGFTRVVLANLFYDVANSLDMEWSDLKEMMDTDPMMSPYYNSPIHKHGRGAGGNCFIKDMAAFRSFFETIQASDVRGIEILRSLERKNIELLVESNKSQNLVESVYGKDAAM
jgi:nucleotide sugar dehydrogenase